MLKLSNTKSGVKLLNIGFLACPRVSFQVGHLLAGFYWKCRFHLVISIFSLEHGGRVAYVETNPY